LAQRSAEQGRVVTVQVISTPAPEWPAFLQSIKQEVPHIIIQIITTNAQVLACSVFIRH
jgi:hypothetical protein